MVPGFLVAVGVVAERAPHHWADTAVLGADLGRRVRLAAAVDVGPVVGGALLLDRRAGGLDHLVALGLARDVTRRDALMPWAHGCAGTAVDHVVGHAELVPVGLVRGELVAAAGAGQAPMSGEYLHCTSDGIQ